MDWRGREAHTGLRGRRSESEVIIIRRRLRRCHAITPLRVRIQLKGEREEVATSQIGRSIGRSVHGTAAAQQRLARRSHGDWQK